MRLPAFFVYRRDAYGHSLGKLPLPRSTSAQQDVGCPRSHRRARSEGARHSSRHLSPPPSALAKPVDGRPAQHTSQRRSATPFHHRRRECPCAREKPAESGQEGVKSRGLSSENAEKITENAELSPDCVAYIVRTSRPDAAIAQARKNGPPSSFRGRGRTDLYRDTAHDGAEARER